MKPPFVKDPAAIKDYEVRWSAWLGTDTISTSVFACDSGLTKVSESNTSTTATVFLGGGEQGRTYRVWNTITSAGGRTEVESFYVTVKRDL